MLGLGFRISDFGFRVSGFGFRVSDFRFQVPSLIFRVSGFTVRKGLGDDGVEEAEVAVRAARDLRGVCVG